MKGGVKFSLIKGALLLRRNVIVLVASYFILYNILPRIDLTNMLGGGPGVMMTPGPYWLYGLTLLIYGGCVLQSLFSPGFREDFERREMIVEIRKMSDECHQNARILKRKLELQAQTRLSNILKETDEIVQSFLSGDKTELKVRVVQQSLKLTAAYIKLADMFRVRAFASDGDKVSQLARRINANAANLNNARDQMVADELRRVIEADEKMLESLKNERFELERIDARLQYMESTIGMLKYNIISNLESEDILNTLENEVHEASALNSVLTERYEERREGTRYRI
jgi:hypothetical protein